MSFIFKRLRDMVLVSGQNEVLLVLLSFFCWETMLVSRAVTAVGRHVLNRLKVDKHGSGFLFSLMVLKRKAPIELDAM